MKTGYMGRSRAGLWPCECGRIEKDHPLPNCPVYRPVAYRSPHLRNISEVTLVTTRGKQSRWDYAPASKAAYAWERANA